MILLDDLLVIHLRFFLVFLNTDVDVVDKDFSIWDIFFLENLRCLHVSESTCSRCFLYWGFVNYLFSCLWTSRNKDYSFSTHWVLFLSIFLFLLFLIWILKLMNKLTSHSIWAISIRTIFLAQLSFVKDWYVWFNHLSCSSMSKRALVSVLAFAI